jgi:hypothetical protein
MSMRPQQVSYVFVIVTIAAWVRAAERRRTPWFLIPLTWVWAMSHGMWPIGIVIGLTAVAGLWLDRPAERRGLLRMVAVPIGSAVAACLTPVGPGLFGAVLMVNSRGKYFDEWAPPDFTRFYCVALLLLLALAIVPRLRRGTSSWFDILLIGLAAAWAVYSLRTVPVAACLVVPFAASGLQLRIGSATTQSRRERLVVVGGYLATLAGLALVVPHTSAHPPSQPSWADRALGSLPQGTKILDESSYGGYLMWRYPKLDVVSNGYGDTFTNQELDHIATIERTDPGWEGLIRAADVKYAVVDPGSSLGYALMTVEHWVVVHQSRDLVMLRPPAGWNAEH